MDLDRFNVAVHGVKAGQFLQEKAASAGVSAVDAALQARVGQVADPDLFKIATQLCPEDALGFYMKLGGLLSAIAKPFAKQPDWAGNSEEVLAKDIEEYPKRPKGETTNEFRERTDREWATKKAEPGPPPGVSSKEWDKVLQKGPEKEAAVLGKVRRVTEGFMKDYARHGDKAMQMPRGQKMVELSSKLMRRGGSFAGGEEAYAASRGYQHKDKKLVELGERLFNAEKTAGDVVQFTRPLASKVKDVVKKVLPAANGTVRKVDFTNPAGVRGALNKARDAAARTAHNTKAMGGGKSSAPISAKGSLPLAGVAALAGGLMGHGKGNSLPPAERKKEEAKAGPIGRAIIKHPALAGAASAGAGALLGMRAKTLPGALAGAVAPGIAALGADRLLKHFEDKKKAR